MRPLALAEEEGRELRCLVDLRRRILGACRLSVHALQRASSPRFARLSWFEPKPDSDVSSPHDRHGKASIALFEARDRRLGGVDVIRSELSELWL